mgnify:CR=1 FL=1
MKIIAYLSITSITFMIIAGIAIPMVPQPQSWLEFPIIPGLEDKARNIFFGREIGLSLGLQAPHPSPRQCVACWIGIKKMTQKKIRAQNPWQSQREYPNRRKPHPCVIMEISRF